MNYKTGWSLEDTIGETLELSEIHDDGDSYVNVFADGDLCIQQGENAAAVSVCVKLEDLKEWMRLANSWLAAHNQYKAEKKRSQDVGLH